MSRNEKFEDEESPSKPPSRRNSVSLSRRSSLNKEKKNLSSAPSSSHSTPKKTVKPQNLELLVTGRQILKRSDRANSLPGYRRPSTESLSSGKSRRTVEHKRPETASSKSRETSLEDDLSLDLSQVSDFEDTNSKYGSTHKFLATSTPKTQGNQPRNFQKPRSCSLQSQMHFQKVENSKKKLQKEDFLRRERESTFSISRDSLYKTSSSLSRYATTDLDYSSVSPGYSGQSGQSSVDLSPRPLLKESPRSQDLNVSSSCINSWQDCSEGNTQVDDSRTDGEWANFWANYNNSLAKVPMKNYYDQCPTPYRTENIDLADLDFSECSRKRSPDAKNINTIIRNEGLHLTPRETQNIIKCAHILGNVLTKAIDRRSKEKDENNDTLFEVKDLNQEILESIINDTNKALTTEKIDAVIEKKNTLTLNLKETSLPLEVKEEKTCETVTTQTDISLPNTKSAPRIFEKILKQLSRTSLDVVENVDQTSRNTKEEEIKTDIKKESC